MHVCWTVALWASVAIFVGGCADERGPAEHLDVNVPAANDGDHYRPSVDTRWQWQLTGSPINLSYAVEIYDIDLFERQGDIASIKAAGFKVICYFSAGSSEDWRDDFDRFAAVDLGKRLDGWAGERWLDIRSPEVWVIMMDRLDLAAAVGCDGVEPDNVEAFNNDSGFSLTAADQLAYNRGLANAAHQRGLSIGLKNDGVQARELVDYYDFCVNEECHEFNECGQYQPFLDAGKPVLNAEYTESNDLAGAQAWGASICQKSRSMGLRTLILPLELDDAFRVSCDEEF